jgi:hypothetical protein
MIFKNLPIDVTIYFEKILDIHRYILKKLVSFGQYVLDYIIERLLSQKEMILLGFGLDLMQNMISFWVVDSLHKTIGFYFFKKIAIRLKSKMALSPNAQFLPFH